MAEPDQEEMLVEGDDGQISVSAQENARTEAGIRTAAEILNERWLALLERFPNGVSSTSTSKYNEIISFFASQLSVSENDMYATGAATRTSNFDTRLVQGNQVDRFTPWATFAERQSSDPHEPQRTLDSIQVTCRKFIGQGPARYGGILLLIELDGVLTAARLLCQSNYPMMGKIQEAFPHIEIVEIISAPNTSSDLSTQADFQNVEI